MEIEYAPENVGLPDEETMSCEDGLVENHYYQDLRWIDLEYFDVFVVHEKLMLDYDGDLESDEALDDLADNEAYVLGLDAGIGLVVCALSVVGAVPVTSCTGGEGPVTEGHYENHPLVLVWCEQEVLDKLCDVAKRHEVNVSGVSTPGILIWVEHGLERMRAFALELIELHRKSVEGIS